MKNRSFDEKKNTGKHKDTGNQKNRKRLRKGILAASLALCLAVSSLLAGCGKKKDAEKAAAAGQGTEQTQTAQQQSSQEAQASQDAEKPQDGRIRYSDDSIFYFKEDAGLAKLKEDMEAGEIPVECKALYDEMGARPVVTVTDPDTIREIYERFAQMTVGNRSERSITDSYHYVSFHLRNDTFVVCRFEGEGLLCWGQENYEVQGTSSLWTYVRALQEDLMEKTASEEKPSENAEAGTSGNSGNGSSGKAGAASLESARTASSGKTKADSSESAQTGTSEDRNSRITSSYSAEAGQREAGQGSSGQRQTSDYQKEPDNSGSSLGGQQENGITGFGDDPETDEEDKASAGQTEEKEYVEEESGGEESGEKEDAETGMTLLSGGDNSEKQPPEEGPDENAGLQEGSSEEGGQSLQDGSSEEDSRPLEPRAAENTVIGQAYSEILRAYSAVLELGGEEFLGGYESGGYAGNVSTSSDISESVDQRINYELLYEHFRDPETNKVFYGLRDFNGDGVQELVIALGSESFSRVWTAYTFDGKKAVELFRGHYSLGPRITLSVLEDKSFLIRASGGASSGRDTICRINGAGTGLETIAEYEYDEQKYGNMDHISTTAAGGAQSLETAKTSEGTQSSEISRASEGAQSSETAQASEAAQPSEGETGGGEKDSGGSNIDSETNGQLPQRLTQEEFDARFTDQASPAEEGISFKILDADSSVDSMQALD